MSSYLDRFMERLAERNPGEAEFQQAVRGVANYAAPLVESEERYSRAKILERLVEPERVIIFAVPWRDDEGEVHVNRGLRVQMNSALGPYKGGLRFHPTVNLSILKFLAFSQVFKNALTGLPMGGGKGGSDFDPKGKSDTEVERFCQSFMNELHRHVGARVDVPAGDIGVGCREVGYLFGQYKRLTGEFSGVLTCKGLDWGGSLLRTEATGYGAVYFAREMLAQHGEKLEGKRVAVSGSGNVAQYTVEKALGLGAKVVTLSDSDGTIVDESGIDEEKLEWVKDLKNVRRGRISDYAEAFDGVEYLEGEKPWGVKCDVAFPSATENELDGADAKRLAENGCLAVIEGANMPTTHEAIGVLRRKGVLFAPGKAANAGGVAVSGLEMAQNAMHTRWSHEEVDRRLEEIMRSIHETCVEYGRDGKQVDYVKGAIVASFRKVADAMLDQGLV